VGAPSGEPGSSCLLSLKRTSRKETTKPHIVQVVQAALVPPFACATLRGVQRHDALNDNVETALKGMDGIMMGIKTLEMWDNASRKKAHR
jgi:hypothetical protein